MQTTEHAAGFFEAAQIAGREAGNYSMRAAGRTEWSDEDYAAAAMVRDRVQSGLENPLTDDEAALLYHVGRYGSDGYPVAKLSGKWFVGPWRSWQGFPTAHKTKRSAVEQFEGWCDSARGRYAGMRIAHPNCIITAIGVKGLSECQS